MYHKIGFSLIVLFNIINSGSLKEIPDYIKVCKRDPTTINECVKNSIEALRPNLIAGIPELEVPGIDPFYIKELEVISSDASPIQAIGKDVKVTGAGNFSIQSISVDLDSFTTRAKVTFPRLHFEGNYNVDIQFLVLPLKGEGTMSVESYKVDSELVLHSEPLIKDGIEYIKFDMLDLDINMKDYNIKLDGLFNGDKVLGEATNVAINENKGEFLKATKPYLEKTASSLLLDIANKMIDGLSYDQLLPKP